MCGGGGGGMHGSYIIFNGIRYIFLSCRGQVVQVMREKMGNTGKWRRFHCQCSLDLGTIPINLHAMV